MQGARSSDMVTARLPALSDYLAPRLGDDLRQIAIREFSGGASVPTFLLTTAERQLVLRARINDPLGIGARSLRREFRALSALHPTGFPVPEPMLYSEDKDLIGAEFYVMGYIEGRIFPDCALPELSNEQRAAVYDSHNATIARLHSIDPDAIGLGDFGRPGNFFLRQVAHWQKEYDAQSRKLPEFEWLTRWIRDNAIQDDRRAIVHNDFSLLNTLIDPHGTQVVGVLDWEAATIGHPLADFAFNLTNWFMPSVRADYGFFTLGGRDYVALGIPTIEQYADSYAERTGYAFSRRDLNFAIAFNFFRLAGMTLYNIARAEDGSAKNELAESCKPYLQPSLDFAVDFAWRADKP
ncbi:MAG: phosphotransferase family protein [Sphingomonadales bacterium]|nr:MAG: phosphotransferase family protein [Sphingomonadales bacterium]